MDDVKGTSEELVAREAARWVQRLKNSSLKEQAEFGRWLRESRAHVRELLLATSWDVVLHHLRHEHRVNVAKLRAACSNVISVKDSPVAPTSKRVRALRWPWLAAVATSLAITAAVLLGALPFLREALWQDFVTPVGEQRAIEGLFAV